jgi:hypothetical protein
VVLDGFNGVRGRRELRKSVEVQVNPRNERARACHKAQSLTIAIFQRWE